MRRLTPTRLFAAAALAIALPSSAQIPPTVNQTVRQSVARLVASGCPGGQRVGTAFLWPNDKVVISARHVVAGCSTLSVTFGDEAFSARPIRELRGHDLVALQLDRASARKQLPVSAALPADGNRVLALGYKYGAPTLGDSELRLEGGNTKPGWRIRDLLSSAERQQLQSTNSIDIATRILRVDGNLMTGMSGGPVIDSSGRLVGVASGGLRDGAGGVVWAVRAEYLQALRNSPKITAVSGGSNERRLFAYQEPQSTIVSRQCGDATFVRSSTLRLSDAFATTDDAGGLQNILQSFGLQPADVDALQFTTWVDEQSGAAIAIPAGTSLVRDAEGNCRAAINDNIGMVFANIDLGRFQAQMPGADVAQIAQSVSLNAEAGLAQEFPVPLQPDPQSSYMMPTARPDGFLVRRIGYGNLNQYVQPPILNYAFITHMMRGPDYVGVAATRKNSPQPVGELQSCAFAAHSAACQQAKAYLLPWAKAVIATHLATMPPI